MHRSRVTTRTAAVVALAVALLAVTACDWTQFRAGPGRAGYVLDQALQPAAVPGLVQRWAGTTGGPVQSSPAIASGVAYVGSDDGKLYAFDATTGAPKWSVSLGAAVVSSPAVDSGVVYVGSDDHKLHAIRLSDQVELWSATLDAGFGGLTSAPLVQGGVVYASSARSLYAYKTDGTPLWAIPVTAAGPLSAPSGAGGLVYVSSYADASLWAYQASGAVAWSVAIPGPRATCPDVDLRPVARLGRAVRHLLPVERRRGTVAVRLRSRHRRAEVVERIHARLHLADHRPRPALRGVVLEQDPRGPQPDRRLPVVDGRARHHDQLDPRARRPHPLRRRRRPQAAGLRRQRLHQLRGVAQDLHPAVDHRRRRRDPLVAGRVERDDLRRVGRPRAARLRPPAQRLRQEHAQRHELGEADGGALRARRAALRRRPLRRHPRLHGGPRLGEQLPRDGHRDDQPGPPDLQPRR